MPEPVVVQAPASVSGTAAYLEVTLTDCAVGNLIVATAQITSSGVRTFTGSDDRANTYVNTNADGTISYAKNVAAGTTVVRMTISSSLGFRMAAVEVQGCSPTDPLAWTAKHDEQVATDNHTSNDATGDTDTPANVFILVQGRTNSTVSTVSAGSGYTAIYATPNQLIQYRTSATALINELGAWTTSGTDRFGASFMGVFKADGARPLVFRRLVRHRRGRR